jgi:large conductance mechanosensitive channel
MWSEFKKFIVTGNIIDFAVAVILAGAVGAVMNSFVDDIIQPVLGYITGGVDFSSWAIPLTDSTIGADGKEVPGLAIKYGNWINTIIKLLLIGLVLFLMLKARNKAMAPPAPEGPTDNELLIQIRDLLKK